MLPANFIEWKRAPGIAGAAIGSRRLLQVFRKIVHVDEFIYGSQARAGNYIFQFAHIAGPWVLEQHGLCSSCQSLNLLTVGFVVFFQKIPWNEQGNIVETLRQTGQWRIWIVLNL